jgi:hypothetical protein
MGQQYKIIFPGSGSANQVIRGGRGGYGVLGLRQINTWTTFCIAFYESSYFSTGGRKQYLLYLFSGVESCETLVINRGVLCLRP